MRRLFFLLLVFSACTTQEPEPVIRPVRVYTVRSPEEARKRNFSGTAKASEEANLSFKVPGTITSLLVNVGDGVKKDQILATLDPLDYNLEVEEREAELARAEARERNASANYERVRKLYETRTASRADLDTARAEAESLIAQVAAAGKGLALALRNLEYTVLTAPTDGAIGEKIAEVNENVLKNQSVLMMVSGRDPEVEVQIPEAMIGQIERGEKAQVRFPALDNEVLRGKVIYIGVATTGTSTTYPVTLRINDPHHLIRSGMTAEVTFTIPYEKGTEIVSVPSVAVGGDLDGTYVYVVTDYDGRYGTVERRPVKVGELLGDDMEIVEGLHGGEKVITAGLDALQPGTKVTLYRGKPYGDS